MTLLLRGCGALPEAQRYTPVRHMPGVGAGAPTASSASLEAFLPPVFDQGGSEGCVGFERAASDFTSLGAQGTPVGLLSPYWSWRMARAIDRDPMPGGLLPVLENVGCQPNSGVRAVQEWGHVAWDDDPPDEAHKNDEPGLFLLEKASVCELVGAYGLSPYSLADDVARVLLSGRTVGLTVQVTKAWDDYRGGVMNDATQEGVSRGRHRVFLYAFEVLPDGTLRVRGRNSWGVGWGDAGNFVGDLSFLMATTNHIAANVRRR